MRTLFRGLAAAALVAAMVPSAACSVKLTAGRDQVQQQVKQQLEGAGAKGIEAVSCPGDLEGTVGTSMKCTLDLVEGLTQTVTVAVTSVEGGTISFDINPDGPPTQT